MKKLLTFSAVWMLAVTAIAQPFPRASQYGEVEQTIGFTEVEVEYYRPNVRDRKIFGGLVPFGEIWRTGANQATTIEFSDPVKFGGVKVDTGTYALFTIPGEKEWTVVLNSDAAQFGAYDHDKEKDVASIQVPVMQSAEKVESFTISFQNVVANKAHLVLAWDKTVVKVEIETELHSVLKEKIEEWASDTAYKANEVYTSAARYYLQDQMHKDALNYINKAIKADDSYWLSWYVKGQILEATDKKPDAIKSMEKALEVGKANAGEEGFKYTERIEGMIKEWKGDK